MKTFPRPYSHLGFCLLFIFLFVLPQIVLSRRFKQQAFKSFQLLEGSRKGQKVNGQHELKQYLRRFGYLSYRQFNSSHIHADDDEFDGHLEAAVKTYQLNYNLNVTGTLDSQTLKQMTMPRCGVPDIINGTNTMRSWQMRNHDGSSSILHIHSDFTFLPNNLKWPENRRDLKYRFRSNAANVLKDMPAICARAFAKWAQVTNFKFTEVSEVDPADIAIGFHPRDHGDGLPFDRPGGVLAHSFAPTDGRSHCDAEENWSLNPDQNAIDLESVVLHELGHIIGLWHTPVMHPSCSLP